MTKGHLVWHHKPDKGGWYATAMDDENRCYVANRVPDGGMSGWRVLAIQRFSGLEPEDLGWFRKLRDAKHAVNEHHHAAITIHGPEDLKAYVERWRT